MTTPIISSKVERYSTFVNSVRTPRQIDSFALYQQNVITDKKKLIEQVLHDFFDIKEDMIFSNHAMERLENRISINELKQWALFLTKVDISATMKQQIADVEALTNSSKERKGVVLTNIPDKQFPCVITIILTKKVERDRKKEKVIYLITTIHKSTKEFARLGDDLFIVLKRK